MAIKCLLGVHDWKGTRCSLCGKAADAATVVSLFTHAAATGNVEAIKDLLPFGPAAQVPDKAGPKAIVEAAFNGHAEVVKLLLHAGVDVDDVDHKAADEVYDVTDGYSAIVAAAENGHAEVVSLLIDAGADVDSVNERGESAIIKAAEKGHAEVVRVLLKAKADINATNNGEYSALHLAASNGHAEVVTVLIDAGAELERLSVGDGDPSEACTPLEEAKNSGHGKVAKLLKDAIRQRAASKH